MNDKQPNILLIMPDQMRGDCLSLEGHPCIQTPNIDAIGGGGTHFHRAYTTCPSCIPARRALLTGMHPANNGMPGFIGGCPIETPTLPDELRRAGYLTALVGRSMHQFPEEVPYGYDERIKGSTYDRNDQYAAELERVFPGSGGVRSCGLPNNGWAARPWHLPDAWHPTAWVVNRSRELIARAGGPQPLFLTTSFYAPHPPLLPPQCYYDRYYNCDDLPAPAIGDWATPPPNDGLGLGLESPRVKLDGMRLRIAQAGYFGLINHIDDQLWWLLHEFRQLSRAQGRPWVVVFTSDHGEMLGDHYYFRKVEPYEGSARIPLLMQASPDLEFTGGQTIESPVCLEDIMPTLLDLAGRALPDNLDGRSLVSTLRGGADGVREVLHGEHAPCYPGSQPHQFMTDGREKYIWRTDDGSEQLFDLTADPHECNDLAGDAARIDPWRNRMAAQLKDRSEGFSDGEKLIAGCEYPRLTPYGQRLRDAARR